jgi:tape measure domain-containing protein
MAKDKNVIVYELQAEDKASPLINNIDSAIKASSESVTKLAKNFNAAQKDLLNLSSLAPSLGTIVESINSIGKNPSASGRVAELNKVMKALNDIKTLNNAINSEVGKELRGIDRTSKPITTQKKVDAYADTQTKTIEIRENLKQLEKNFIDRLARAEAWVNSSTLMERQNLTNLKSKEYARGTEKSISTNDADLFRHAGFKALDKTFSNEVRLTAHDIEKLILQGTSGIASSQYKKVEKELEKTFAPYFAKLDRRTALGKPEYVYNTKIDPAKDRTRKEIEQIEKAIKSANNLVDIKRHVNKAIEVPRGTPITQEQTWSPVTFNKKIKASETEIYKQAVGHVKKAIDSTPANLVDKVAKYVADRLLSTSTKDVVIPTKAEIRKATTVTETFDPRTGSTSKYLSPEDVDYVKRLHAVGDILKHNAVERQKTVKVIDEQIKAEEKLAKLRTPSTESLARKALRDEASSRTGESGRAGFAANVANIDAVVKGKELEKTAALMNYFREDVGKVVNYYTRLKTLSKDAFSADYLQRLSAAFSSAASELNNYVSVSNLVITTAYETIHSIADYNNSLQKTNVTLTEQEKLELKAVYAIKLLEERLSLASTDTRKYAEIQKQLKTALATVNAELKEMHTLLKQTTNLQYLKLTVPKDYNALTTGLKNRLTEEAIIAESGANSIKHIEYKKAKDIEKIWKDHENIKKNQMDALQKLEITPLRDNDGNENKIRAVNIKALNNAIAANIDKTEKSIRTTNAHYAAQIKAVTALQDVTKFTDNYSAALSANLPKLSAFDKLEADMIAKRTAINDSKTDIIAARRDVKKLYGADSALYANLKTELDELNAALKRITSTYKNHKALLQQNDLLSSNKSSLSASYTEATNKLRQDLQLQEIILKHGADNYRVLEYNKAKAVEEIWKKHEERRLAFEAKLANIEAQPHLLSNGRVNPARNMDIAALQNSIAANVRNTSQNIASINAEYDARIRAARATDDATRSNRENSESLLTNGRASQHLLTRLFQFDIGHRIVRGVVSAISDIPKVGIELDSARATFTAVFGTLENVNKEFEYLDELALRTGASISVLREQYGQFASSAKFSGESAGKIRAIFNDITEAGTVLHLPADKLRSAFVAINQMYGKNQVMMEELKKQLGNQLPAAVSIFALSMGITTRKLMEDMKKGLVLPKETLAKFAATYRDFFADTSSFALAARGLNAELGRLSNSWTYLVQSIYENTSGKITASVKLFANGLELIKNNLEALNAAFSALLIMAGGSFLSHLVTKFALSSASIATTATFLEKLKGLLPVVGAWFLKLGTSLTIFGNITTALYVLSHASETVNNREIKLLDLVEAAWERAKKAKDDYFVTKEGDNKTTLDKAVDNANYSMDYTNKVAKGFAVLGKNIIDDVIGTFTGDLLKARSPFRQVQEALAGQFSWAEIFHPELVKDVLKKKDAEEVAAKQKAFNDKLSSDIKEALIKGSEDGSEEMFTMLQSKVNKYLETFNKLSEAITATAEVQAKVQLHAIQLEQQLLEKNFKTNSVSFLKYFETRVSLAEKEYEIAVRRNALEKDVALRGLEEARKFRDVSVVNYSQSVTPDKADKARKELSNIEAAIAYANVEGSRTDFPVGGIVIKDKVGESKKSEDVVRGTPAYQLVEKNLKLAQEDLAARKANKETLSAQQEYILGLEKVPLFYETDITALRKTIATFVEETAKGVSNLNVGLSEKTVAGQRRIDFGTGGEISAKLFNETSAKVALLNDPKKKELIAQIYEISAREGVKNQEAFLANLTVESGLNQKAISSKGAIGIGQVMRTNTYAKDLDITTNEGNITAASRFWKHLEEKYGGNLRKTAGAYNAGEKGVDENHADTTFPETINHIDRVSALYSELVALSSKLFPELSLIAADNTKKSNQGNLVSASFNGETRIIQLESKELDAQYTKEKALEELERLRLEHTEKTKDAFIQSNIAVLKLNSSGQEQATILETQLKFKNDLKLLNNMEADHAELDKRYNEARTAEARNLIELKRSQLVPLTKEEVAKQKENIKILSEKELATARANAAAARLSNKSGAFDNRLEAINLQESGGSFGKYGAAYARSAANRDKFAEMNSRESRNDFMTKAISDSGGDRDLLANKMASFNNELEKTKQAGQEVADLFANEVSGNITTALTDWATGNKTAMESVKALGASIIKMIMDVIVQELILAKVKLMIKAMLMLVGGVSTGGSVDEAPTGKYTGGVVGYAGGGNVLQFPSGGKVRGKGNSLSDSNYAAVPKGSYVLKASSANALTNKYGSDLLVRLSNDEIVVPPALVKKYGKDFFDKANSHGDFAAGGSVGNIKDNVKPMSPKHNNVNSSNVNNITVNVDGTGKDGKELGNQISIEIVKQIAKQEAQKQVNVNNKQQRTAQRRVV